MESTGGREWQKRLRFPFSSAQGNAGGNKVAVYDWEDIWPKGIRRKFNREPSPTAKSNASGFLKVNLLQ